MFSQVYIEITNKCNFNCWFCYATKRKKEIMSLETFESILKQIKPYTKKIALHVLGEPLTHPHFEQILSLTETYGFTVHLVTNGSLLSRYKQCFLDNRSVRLISVSLQAYSNQLPVHLLDTISKLSEVKTFQLRHWFYNQCEDKISEAIKNYYSIEELFDKMTLDHNIYLSLENPFEWPDSRSSFNSLEGTCLGTRKQLAILSNGQLVPCCFDGDGSINLGNILKTPFSLLLETERLSQMKKGFQENRIIEKTCQNCHYRNRFSQKNAAS